MFFQQSSSGAGAMLSTLTHTDSRASQYTPRPIPLAARGGRPGQVPLIVPALESTELRTLPVRNASQPTTPADEEAPQDVVEAMEPLSGTKNRYRLAAICLTSMLAGFNDSAAGALIPYMEK
ncbi:hypothetical protein TruAng_011821 [Truncatella angustata]|nr:hypothetical protein TruAng_011821 [Truncatella angustata]